MEPVALMLPGRAFHRGCLTTPMDLEGSLAMASLGPGTPRTLTLIEESETERVCTFGEGQTGRVVCFL